MPVIEESKLIPDHQFGFRQKHATIEQIHRLIYNIQRVFEERKYYSAVFLDVSQAFDKVRHKGLLYKLKTHLPHPYYDVLKSYLTNRYFVVKYQEEVTTLSPIYAGVPQGSVLGSVLYQIYTYDIPVQDNNIIATYADDTAIMAIDKLTSKASESLQKYLNELQKWLEKWKVKVNEIKSTNITFSLCNGNCPPIKLDNQEIPVSNVAKYLRLHIDRRLTWKTDIIIKRKQLGLKFSKLYWLIGRRPILSLDSKLMVYKSILKPIWTYGIQLWGTASNTNIDILQRFQSKSLRIICTVPHVCPTKLYIRTSI